MNLVLTLILALACTSCQTLIKDKEEVKHIVSDAIDEETTALESKQLQKKAKKKPVVVPPMLQPQSPTGTQS